MTEIRFKEDFTFEGTSSRRLCNKNSGWSTHLMDPVIETNEFVFTIKINKLKNLMLGVCRPYYPRSTFMGKEEEQCWILFNSSGDKSQICANDEEEKKNSWKDVSDEFPCFLQGDELTFYVNKKKKTIHVKKTRGRKFLLYEDADLPAELSISCSRRTDPVDIELIHYEEKFGEIEYNEDRWFDEKTIEFRAVCKNYTNFQIPLKNRVLRFPKLFLLGTNLPNLKFSKEFRGLSSQSFPGLPEQWSDLCQLMIDYPSREKVMEKILKQPGFDYVDYYRFSKALGLGTGMNQIRELFSEMSFSELYKTFKDAVTRLENDEIKGWFVQKPVKNPEFGIKLFDSAFCMQLFVEMRNKMGEVDEEVLKKDIFMGMTKQRLLMWERRKNPMSYMKHKDFENVRGKRGVTYHDIFGRLQRDRNFLSNITVISSDKKEFPAHIEVLICGFLDRFTEDKLTEIIEDQELEDIPPSPLPQNEEEQEGEGQEMKKKIILEVDEMEGALLRVFLDFAYQSYSVWLGNVPLHRLIHAMYHANKDRDFRLLSILCERLEKLTQPTGEKEDVENVIRKIGHLLHKNYELSPWIFPRLIRHSNRTILKEEIEELVKKAHRKNMVTHHVSYLSEKVKGLAEEIQDLRKMGRIVRIKKKEMEKMKKENTELKIKCIKMEEFLKTKFGKNIF